MLDGITPVPEMLNAGIDVAFGHDCVMDPWYPLGSADMLEVAHMGLHVAQMTEQDASSGTLIKSLTSADHRTPFAERLCALRTVEEKSHGTITSQPAN